MKRNRKWLLPFCSPRPNPLVSPLALQQNTSFTPPPTSPAASSVDPTDHPSLTSLPALVAVSWLQFQQAPSAKPQATLTENQVGCPQAFSPLCLSLDPIPQSHPPALLQNTCREPSFPACPATTISCGPHRSSPFNPHPFVASSQTPAPADSTC